MRPTTAAAGMAAAGSRRRLVWLAPAALGTPPQVREGACLLVGEGRSEHAAAWQGMAWHGMAQHGSARLSAAQRGSTWCAHW